MLTASLLLLTHSPETGKVGLFGTNGRYLNTVRLVHGKHI